MAFKNDVQRRACFARLHLKKGKIPDSKFNEVQLRRGTLVEKEHTNNPLLAKQIAKAHLVETRDYYKKLKKAGL